MSGLAEYIQKDDGPLNREQDELVRSLFAQIEADGLATSANAAETEELRSDLTYVTRRDLFELEVDGQIEYVPFGPFASHERIRECFRQFRNKVAAKP